MTRAPISALLLALTIGSAVLSNQASATSQGGGDVRAGERLEALVLPKRALAAAVRRTAVADADLDGEVTSAEAAQYYEARFRILDENRDGWIDAPEFLHAAAVRSLHAVDGFSQPRPLAFESVDVDGNGTLTPEEFLRADLMRRRLASVGDVDARRQALFEVADADRDGALSVQEFVSAGSEHFGRSDADGDGRVTIWEFYGGASL